MPRGEKDKLTDAQKDRIMILKGVMSAYLVAEEFGVTHTTIYNVWKSKRNQKKPLYVPTFTDIINEIREEGIKGFNLSPEKLNDKPYRMIFDMTIEHIRRLNETN
ncbi:hypothetical protein LCGC14_0266840 [marine sediment metagenome]|uniref:Uncharacterized protein n=1 Tax=marine sediment metagenome TaxID=412755 RepID=A0A0F9X4N1_9ZZZZ